jgi:HD-GYP domain-containing protein (c-di-GMP phosphodiesterase class II)
MMAEVAKKSEFQYLTIGLSSEMLVFIQNHLPDILGRHVQTMTDFEELLEGVELAAEASVFASHNISQLSHNEIAQTINSSFPGLRIFFLTSERRDLDFEVLRKNGFTDIFFLPIDQSILIEKLDQVIARQPGGGENRFKAVKLVDIQPDEEIPFNVRVFLPLNRKFALLTSQGKLSQAKYQKLKNQSVNSVFVEQKELELFYEFTATKLFELGKSGNDAIPQTEKDERLRCSIRDLVRSVLNQGASSFDEGRELADQAVQVTQSFLKMNSGLDIKEQISKFKGEGDDFYSHAQIVSSLACLLSLATGIGKPEELALAGLFHDLGLQDVPPLTTIFNYSQLTDAEKIVYSKHPMVSLNILKERRITISPAIGNIIEKHHERMDGKGFPKQLPSFKVPKEAHLLAYADAYEYLSRPQPGLPNLPFEEIHRKIEQELSLNPEVLLLVMKKLS